MAKKEKQTCPMCGHEKFEKGRLRSHGIKFLPDTASWVKKQFSGAYSIEARRCTNCGNVQMYA